MAPIDIDKNNIQYDVVSRFGFGGGERTEIVINSYTLFEYAMRVYTILAVRDFQRFSVLIIIHIENS